MRRPLEILSALFAMAALTAGGGHLLEQRISGRVVTGDGDLPVGKAMVVLDLRSSEEPVDCSSETNAEGGFEVTGLRDGIYDVLVTHEELVPAHDPLQIDVRGDRDSEPLLLRMKPGIEIRGKVCRSDTGVPLKGVEVTLTPSPPTPGDRFYPGGSRAGTSSADGTFLVRGLKEGNHTVTLAARGYLRRTLPDLPVSVSSPRLDFTLEPGYTLSGKVLDPDDQPVPGARVRVDLRPLSDRHRSQLSETKATTDEKGHYQIEGLAPGYPYRILAAHKGHALGWTGNVEVGPEAESREVHIHLRRGRSVRGRVLDEQGRALPDAQVASRVIPCGDSMSPEVTVLSGVEFSRTTTDERGEYHIRNLAGHCYTVEAEAEGLLPGSLEVRHGDWGSDERSAEDVDLHLRRPREVRGRVLDDRGVPVANVFVKADWQPKHDVTDPDGVFSVGGLAAGQHTLTASREGYQDAVFTTLVPCDDITLTLERSAVVTGRIRVPGQPGRVRVRVRVFGESGRERGTTAWAGDGVGEGRFEVAVAPGKHVVQAEAPGLAPARSPQIIAGPGEHVDSGSLSLLPGSVLRGTLRRRESGRPLQGVTVMCRPRRNLGFSREAATAEDGTFAVDHLPPGEYAVEAQDVWRSRHTPARFGPFAVTGRGDREVSLDTPGGGTLRGVLHVDGRPPAERLSVLKLFLLRDGREAFTGVVDADGTFECGGLSPGSYEVLIRGSRVGLHDFCSAPRQVRLRAGRVTEVSFDEPGPVPVEGHVTRGGRPLAGASIEARELWRGTETRDRHPDFTPAATTTNPAGRYRLALHGGRVHQMRVAETGADGWFEVAVELPERREPFPLDIALGSERLDGQVVEPGTVIPVEDVFVELFTPAEEKRSYLSVLRLRRAFSRTDAKGRFSFKHIHPGMYSVRLAGRTWTHGLVVKDTGSRQLRLELEPELRVEFHLVDPQGYPVEDADGIIRNPFGHFVAALSLDSWGIGSLPDLYAPPGSCEVTVIHPGFAPVRIPIDLDGKPRVYSRVLVQGGSLQVVVVDSSGNPVSRAEVSVLDDAGRQVLDDWIPADDIRGPSPPPGIRTGEQGRLHWSHLQPGEYRIRARKDALHSNEGSVTVVEGKMATIRRVLAAR